MVKQLQVLCIVLLTSFASYAQEPVKADTLIKQLDSLQEHKDTTTNNIDPDAYNAKTTLGLKTYFILLGSNLKQQFTAPFHTKGKSWYKVAAFGATIAALTFADKPVSTFTSKVTKNSGGIVTTSRYLTNISGTYEAFTLSAIGAFGFITNNQKLKTTTLLASQAYITGAVVESFLKLLSGRQRPNYYDENGNNNHTFHGPFGKAGKDVNGNKLNSSFPSGHATVAFAAATVFAKEYRDIKWVPIVSYTAASLIGMSRLTENKHWISDVVAGAVFGFLTGKQIVNNYHRYARIQSGQLKKKKTSLSFQMNSVQGKILPGVALHF